MIRLRDIGESWLTEAALAEDFKKRICAAEKQISCRTEKRIPEQRGLPNEGLGVNNQLGSKGLDWLDDSEGGRQLMIWSLTQQKMCPGKPQAAGRGPGGAGGAGLMWALEDDKHRVHKRSLLVLRTDPADLKYIRIWEQMCCVYSAKPPSVQLCAVKCSDTSRSAFGTSVKEKKIDFMKAWLWGIEAWMLNRCFVLTE